MSVNAETKTKKPNIFKRMGNRITSFFAKIGHGITWFIKGFFKVLWEIIKFPFRCIQGTFEILGELLGS